MENVKHQLQNIANELSSVINTMNENKGVGRELYLVADNNQIYIYQNLDDVKDFLIDDYGVSSYDDWFDDLCNSEIADICAEHENLCFREAMEQAYDEYVENEIKDSIMDLSSDDCSIRRADESRVIRLRVV